MEQAYISIVSQNLLIVNNFREKQMENLHLTYENPDVLVENPWNPNVMDSINEEKLENSLDTLGMKDVVKCRTLPDGSLQIISGKHRARALKKRGLKVPVLHLGVLSDDEAKKISLVSNEHYGENDLELMNQLFKESGWSELEITAISTMDTQEFEDIFAHNATPLDFEDLDLNDDLDLDSVAELETIAPAVRTHQIMRFKVAVEDAPAIQDFINNIKKVQGFTESDELTNAGDALVFGLGTHPEFKHD